LRADCAAHARGDPESFPVKDARRQRRLRRGAAFVVLRADGCLLLRTRSARGLLGGMTEVPTTEWTDHFDEANALAHAPMLLRAHPPPRRAGEDEGGERKLAWRRAPGVVSHVFTHFPLELVAFVAHAPAGTEAPAGMRWVPFDRLDGEALPNLMRKVIAHARLVPDRKTKASQAERAAVTPAPPAPARAKRRSR
jgi:A/G-specific adenine glycosylase